MKGSLMLILGLVAVLTISVMFFLVNNSQLAVNLPNYANVHSDVQITNREEQMIAAYDAIRSLAETATEKELVSSFVFEKEYTRELFLAEGVFLFAKEIYETQEKQEQCTKRYERSAVDLPCRFRSLFPPLLGLYNEEIMTLVAIDGNDLWFSQISEGRANDVPTYGQIVYRIPFDERDGQWSIKISSTADPYDIEYYDVGSAQPIAIDKARDRALSRIGK